MQQAGLFVLIVLNAVVALAVGAIAGLAAMALRLVAIDWVAIAFGDETLGTSGVIWKTRDHTNSKLKNFFHSHRTLRTSNMIFISISKT